MRIVSPEQQAIDEQWARTLFTDVASDSRSSPVDGMSGEEFAAQIARHIENETAQGWELVRETAEATLAENPADETAQEQMLAYQQFKRKPTFVVGGKPKDIERVGVWALGSDGRYYIKIARCGVGDKVLVKRAKGNTQRYELTERVAHNLYKGRGL